MYVYVWFASNNNNNNKKRHFSSLRISIFHEGKHTYKIQKNGGLKEKQKYTKSRYIKTKSLTKNKKKKNDNPKEYLKKRDITKQEKKKAYKNAHTRRPIRPFSAGFFRSSREIF